MGAAADGDAIGVAGDEAHAFDRHTKPFDDQLGKARLVPLALRGDADDQFDESFRRNRDLGLLARHARGDIDIISDADAAIFAALFRLGAPALEALPVAEFQRQIHAADVIAVVVFDAERIFVRQFLFGHEIAPPQRHAIVAAFARGEIDQPLHDEDHLGASGAAIRPRRRGVAQGSASAEIRRRHPVDARHHLHALLHHGEIGGVGAEIAEIGAAHGQKLALGVERQFGFDGEIARLVVAQERLMALDDPFHGPAELLCRPCDQRELGVDHATGTEIAADVLHQHADFFRRHVEHGGEIVLQPHRAAIAGIDRVAAALGIVGGERGARLHRHAGDALHPGFEPGDVGGAGKGGVGRRRVAKLAVEADIRQCAVVHPRRILARGGNGSDDRRQNVVIDRNTLGAVLRRVHGFGNHHRHRFADETRLVGRQRIMRRFERRLVAFEVQLGLLHMRRPRLVRDRFEAVGREVHAGQHREHTGCGLGIIGRDAANARMCVRRAHHDRIDLTRKIFVGGIAPTAAHQTQILAPPYRLADAGAVCGFSHRCVLSSL